MHSPSRFGEYLHPNEVPGNWIIVQIEKKEKRGKPRGRGDMNLLIMTSG